MLKISLKKKEKELTCGVGGAQSRAVAAPLQWEERAQVVLGSYFNFNIEMNLRQDTHTQERLYLWTAHSCRRYLVVSQLEVSGIFFGVSALSASSRLWLHVSASTGSSSKTSQKWRRELRLSKGSEPNWVRNYPGSRGRVVVVVFAAVVVVVVDPLGVLVT